MVYAYQTKKGTRFLIKGPNYYHRGFKSEQEASLFEAKNYPSKKAIRYPQQLEKDFIEYLRDRYKITAICSRINLLKVHVFPFFAKILLARLCDSDLKRYNDLVNASPGKSKMKILTMARKYLDFLKKNGASESLDENLLFVKKSLPFYEPQNFDYYTLEEFKIFMSSADKIFDKLFFNILFYLGLRMSEIRGLKWRDIVDHRLFIKRNVTNRVERHHQVEVACKSSSSVRDFLLPDFLMELFQEFKESKRFATSPEDYIFDMNGDGLVITETPIRVRNEKIAQKSGIRRIKPHEFRHSCATYLFDCGFSIEQVAAWLGHSSPIITYRIYVHLLPKKKDEIAVFLQKNR